MDLFITITHNKNEQFILNKTYFQSLSFVAKSI